MSADDDIFLRLLSKAVMAVLGKRFYPATQSGVKDLRKIARQMAAHPDSVETERLLDSMKDLDDQRRSEIRVTKGVAPVVIQLNIPEECRVLKKGRTYF